MTTKPQQQQTVTVEIFAKDLWEAMREELREQIGTITGLDFDLQVPAWDRLTPEARQEKILSVRNEVLKPITRAGYEIRRRV